MQQYTYGRVLRTQEPGSQPQVLSQLLSGLTASLRFLSGGRPPGMKASFRFSASGEGRAGVATRNRSFETWALSITKTTFLQRRVDFLSPRPTACCADRERYQLRFLQVLTSHQARSRQLRFLADQTTRQPEVLNTGGSLLTPVRHCSKGGRGYA